jgi:hypothetical protein
VPRHSSERRAYIPLIFASQDIIASDSLLTVPNAELFHFAVMKSSMHMAWMRAICGRLKSDFRYSKDIVYNNFVWCDLNDKSKRLLTLTGQAIVDARNLYPQSSLAVLYGTTMPAELVKAHDANNKAVDKTYGYKGCDDDASRVAFLFKKYEELTSLLPSATVKKKHVKKSVK